MLDKKSFLSNVLLLSILVIFGCKKSDPGSDPKTDPQAGKNQFSMSNASNLVLLNSPLPSEGSNLNFTDDKGNFQTLKIPDAKNFTLNVNSVIRCTPKYIYLEGTLKVEYLSGKQVTYMNFILDTETGDFYNVKGEIGTVLKFIWRGNPWVNGGVQYDGNNSIYVSSSSSQLIQEITKFDFEKISDTEIKITSSKLNLISGTSGFYFYVLKNGDIVYLHNPPTGSGPTWFYRKSTGKITELSQSIIGNSLIIDNVKYFDKVNSFGAIINHSDGTPLLFISGTEGVNTRISPIWGVPMSPNNIFYKIFTFESAPNDGIRLKSYSNAKFDAFYTPQEDINWYSPYRLLIENTQGMWYFKSGTTHTFATRDHVLSQKPSSFWWNYNEENNSMVYKFIPYSVSAFDTYKHLLTSSSNNGFLPIKNDFYRINLKTLDWQKTTNTDFQIFKTSYIGDEKVQFYGISFLNGKKILGEIDQNGSVKIIKEFENQTEVKEFIRIGKF